jgi:hypothetical protein
MQPRRRQLDLRLLGGDTEKDGKFGYARVFQQVKDLI